MSNKQLKNNDFLIEVLAHAGWQIDDYFSDKVNVADSFTISLCGITAKNPQGILVSGSAGAMDDDPAPRAQYELLERILLYEASMARPKNPGNFLQKNLHGDHLATALNSPVLFPESPTPQLWQYARSNGVACHSNWLAACTSAAFELVERELVLAAWLGQRKPECIEAQSALDYMKPLLPLYEPLYVDFGASAVTAWPQAIRVNGVFLFPRKAGLPLVYGFGADFSAAGAMQRASTEACQRLGFLWGEDLPTGMPEFQAHPLYHQDYYLLPAHHHLVRSWLAGDFFTPWQAPKASSLVINFFDLTPKKQSAYKLAKATCADTTPLIFGQCDRFAYADLPENRKIHPLV